MTETLLQTAGNQGQHSSPDTGWRPTLLPRTHHEIRQLAAAGGDPAISRLLHLLQSDPAAALDLVARGNEALRHHRRDPSLVPEHLILLLGPANVLQGWMELPPCPDDAPEILGSRANCLLGQALAEVTARQASGINAEEGGRIALLLGLEELLAADTGLEPGSSEARSGASALLEAWGLSGLLQAEEGAAWLARYCQRIAHLAERGWYHEEMCDLIEELAGRLKTDHSRLAILLHRQTVEQARSLHALGLPTDAARRLLDPVVPGEPARDDTGAESAVREVMQPPPAAVAPPATGGDHCDTTSPAPDEPAAWQTEVDKVLARLEEESGLYRSPQQTLSLVLRTLGGVVGIERVVFALLSRDRSTLQVRAHCHGTELLKGSGGYRLSGRDLFSHLLQRPALLHVHGEERERYLAALPPSLRQRIGEGEAAFLSLGSTERPLGLLWIEHPRLQPEQLAAFRRLGRALNRSLLRAGERKDG